MASTSMESDGPEPDLLDEFFAEISNPEAKSSNPVDSIFSSNTIMTPTSPEEDQNAPSLQSLDGDLGEPSRSSRNSKIPPESSTSDQSSAISINQSLTTMIVSDESAETSLATEMTNAAGTSTSAEVSAEEVATSLQPESSASSPNHDFSIEDLVSQDIDQSKLSSSEVESVVFKRPVSPSRLLPSVSDEASPVLRPEDAQNSSGIGVRARKDGRLTSYPLQRCFLSQQKRKRPETDSGHLVSILRTVQSREKLLIPDAVLVDYLDEAGLNVADGKVPRLLGVAAEHHVASIIQDVLQIYLNGQQDKKRQGKEKEGGGGYRTEKKERSKGRLGRPTSAATKPAKKRGSNGKDKKKQTNFDDPDQIPVDIPIDLDRRKNSALYDNDDLPGDSQFSSSAVSHDAMDVDGEALDRSEARSIISKDERESERTAKKDSKKDREKEADKRNILTLDLLAPVLREQGYQIGFPPYFVN